MKPFYAPLAVLLSALCITLVLGCAPGGGGTAASQPVVAIGAPQNGDSFTVGETVAVQSASADASGIIRVELYVDGQLVQTSNVQNPSATQNYPLVQEWVAAAPGAHSLAVRAFNLAGLSGERTVAVNVMSAAPDGTATETLGNGGEATTIAAAPTATRIESAPPAGTETPASFLPAGTTDPTGCTLDAEFVSDTTVPDGTIIASGQAFVKTWLVRNSGACPWTPGFTVRYESGAGLATDSEVPLPAAEPGVGVEVSVNMQAPAVPGNYRADWRLYTAEGSPFGATLSVVINVPAPAPPTGVPTVRPTVTPAALVFNPFYPGGENVAVDTQGDTILIEASFSPSDGSVIDYVIFYILDGNGNLIVQHRKDDEPYCYRAEQDNFCDYYDFAANNFRWHNNAPVREGLHFVRAVGYATNGTVRVSEQPFWIDLQGNHPQPNVFLGLEQTQPGDTSSEVRNALVFQASLFNDGGLNINRLEMSVTAFDGTVLQKITRNNSPYCAFDDQNNVCNTYDFAQNNFLWANGARISETMVVLRATAYQDNTPVAGLSQSVEIYP